MTSNLTLFKAYGGGGHLKSADVGNLDVSGAKGFRGFFADQPNLTTITGLENWDTSHATDMASMFQGDSKLTKLDLTPNGNKWDTSHVTDMGSMFAGDGELVTIGVPGLDIPSSINSATNHMFDGCVKLIRCNQPGEHTWPGGTDPLHWKETLTGTIEHSNCVLELESGTVPDYGTADTTNVPWSQDPRITKVKIDDGVKAPTTLWGLFEKLTGLTTADVSGLDTTGATLMGYIFNDDTNLTTVTGIDNWATGSATDMSYMFNGCGKLPKVDLSHHGGKWDTSSVTNMDYMFTNDAELTTIGVPGLEIPNGINSATNHMFDGCVKLIHCGQPGEHTWGDTDPLHWKETMDGSIDNPQCVLELEKGTIPDYGQREDGDAPIPWKEPGVTKLVVNTPAPGQPKVKMLDGYGLFDGYNLPNLRAADVTQLDTSQATNFGRMFQNAPLLETITGLGELDTHSATSMKYMFCNSTKLTSLDLTHDGDKWDTSHVTDMSYMFNGITGLISLDLSSWDVGHASDMSYMFQNDNKLTTIGDVHAWHTGLVTNMNSMFQNNAALVGEQAPLPDARITPNGKTLDLSSWNTHNVTDMRFMFQNCGNLESLDISGWDMRALGKHSDSGVTTSILNQSQMLENCPKLYRIKVGPTTDFSPSHENSQDYCSPVAGEHDWVIVCVHNINYYSPVKKEQVVGSANHPATTPAYKNFAQTAWMRGGSDTNNMAPGRFPSPEWIYLVSAQYSGACDNGDAVPFNTVCTPDDNPGHRFIGWRDTNNGGYAPGSVVPYSVPGGILTALWQTPTAPPISKATPHTDGTLTVGGIVPGGTLTGDKFTLYPYSTETGGTHGPAKETTTATAITATAPNDAPWGITYTTATNPYPDDKVGSGVSYWFTSTLTQADNSVSAESAPRTKLTIDTTTPALVNTHIAKRTPSSAPGVQATITGTAWTSGNATAQPNRTVEAGDRVTITWPDHTTSGAKADGTPLEAGTSGSIVTQADGSFTVDVPASQPLDGSEVTVTLWDNADGSGINPAKPAGYENKANKTSVSIRLRHDTVNKLPLTGHHWQANGLIGFAVVAALAVTTGAYAQRKRQRH
ncbi:BspA family leucine-rich repeat surface protein [Bifidobacterium sp. ESL0790]|uniref:BspA family leucine-rich repeat surface protein n=1 Tax=Bifidobacterium sp. ESL0790 TaxID=2983233 RepID=UPI0023F8736F|nr:BspA family leucine-rich repeat surface protein [Bifidobacterium sp. ESL0790]WEV71861.1 BspA family leucine-rich repeat surface protein [Bifidobacterium sp. ESL0790]